MNNHISALLKLTALGSTLALAAGCTTDNFYQNPPSRGAANASRAPMPMATAPMQTQPQQTVIVEPDATNAFISTQAAVKPAWNEDRTSLEAEKVYFNFDKSAIRFREQSKLNQVADFLKGNAQVSVRIEGNCDERGTEEFNRELGALRAAASRDYLVSRGIDPSRIQTLSRGKDNPAVTAEDGKDRSLNRRDEFVVLTSDKVL